MGENTNSRRDFLKQASLLGVSAFGASSAYGLDSRSSLTASQKSEQIPFFGTHQAGISTPAQRHIYFAVLELHTEDRAKIKEIFKTWTAYARNLTEGKNVKAYAENSYVPPVDTGEADGLNPHKLTLTFGVSPSFFSKLNIRQLQPSEFTELPHFPRDQLQESYTGGEICIQACADDAQVAFHAVRNLIRVARGEVSLKWSQAGFNSFEGSDTPRNLFGFKDGTGNPTGAELERILWYQHDNWLKGGTYLVVRRIKTFLETWDRTNLAAQEETFGRHRDSGAPLGSKNEFDEVELDKLDDKGNPVIPVVSHTRIARATGITMLRRSFSYASGIDSHGQLDAGLLFISFQRHPQRFIQIQNAFGNVDKLNEYITHIGSGIFACFAGVKDENDYLGSALFEQI